MSYREPAYPGCDCGHRLLAHDEVVGGGIDDPTYICVGILKQSCKCRKSRIEIALVAWRRARAQIALLERQISDSEARAAHPRGEVES